MVLDIERGRADRHPAAAVADRHLHRRLALPPRDLRAAPLQVRRHRSSRCSCDIVSKNGNLLLNIPLRGDGTIDEDERKVLADLAAWMPVNGEAIYGTRPFTVFGEGPPDVKGSANFNENNARPYTAEDIRFTTRGDTLYAFALAWPDDGKLTIKSLARGSAYYPREIGKIELLGRGTAPLPFTRDAAGTSVTLPAPTPADVVATLKITPG